MKITDLVRELNKLKKEHGNLEVLVKVKHPEDCEDFDDPSHIGLSSSIKVTSIRSWDADEGKLLKARKCIELENDGY